MRIGHAATSIALRVLIFCFVIASLRSSGQQGSNAHEDEGSSFGTVKYDSVSTFSRAWLGVGGSVALTCLLLIVMAGFAGTPVPAGVTIALRGSIQ
jgi:hypothetical protein